MNLLKREEEVDAVVTWDDQKKINAFGKLTGKHGELKDDLANKQKEFAAMEDASDDLLAIIDDDELVNVKVGEVFVAMTQDEATERLDQLRDALTDEMESLKTTISSMEGEMKELKSQLYAKFGRSINLEVS